MDEKYKEKYVIDSSFALAYLLPDEDDNYVQEIFDLYKTGKIDIISAQLLPFEVINGMYAATLSKRIDQLTAKLLINDFLHLPFILDEVDYDLVFDIAEKYRVSIYDASYAALAKSKKAKLLSLDKNLQKITI